MNYAPDCADCPMPDVCQQKGDCQVVREIRHRHEGTERGGFWSPSDRERVLARWPKAVCVYAKPVQRYLVWHRIDATGDHIGDGVSESAAWADAARRIKER